MAKSKVYPDAAAALAGIIEDGMTIDGGPWKRNMRENHIGRAEDKILQFDMRKDGYGISEPAGIADNCVMRNVSVLAEAAVFPDHGTGFDMREIPDLGVFADLGAVIDDRGRMYKCRRSIFLRFGHKEHSPSGAVNRPARADMATPVTGLFYINKSHCKSRRLEALFEPPAVVVRTSKSSTAFLQLRLRAQGYCFAVRLRNGGLCAFGD